MKRIAIIPARGGSKRIPRKNIRVFIDKPILAYSIEAALRSRLFDEVMVSTDDPEIAQIAVSYGANVPFFRSEKTSNDYAGTADVLLEVLEEYRKTGQIFDLACCIYPTAPFVTEEKLREAERKLLTHHFDSVFVVVPFSYPVLRGLRVSDNKVAMIWPEYAQTRSQELDTVYHDAGQFYFFRTGLFLTTGQLWTSNTGAVVASELEVQDIDTDIDWKLAEMKYQLLKGE